MANKNYKITLRRRLPTGVVQTATYNLVHVQSSGGDDEQGFLLSDMEEQSNMGAHSGGRPLVRVLVEEV